MKPPMPLFRLSPATFSFPLADFFRKALEDGVLQGAGTDMVLVLPPMSRFGLVDKVNARHPGRIRLVLKGHHHCDRLVQKSGVAWFTVNSPNPCWMPRRHQSYPVEDMKRWKEIDHIVAYDTPVSAVLTKTASGFDVKGMQGSFWRGVTPELVGCSPFITPHIGDRTI